MGAHGTRFEFECYDVGHLYNLAHFLDRGLVQPPLFVQTIFGILGGIGTDPEDLLHMKRTADRLLGNDYIWSILGAGRHQFNLITMGAIMGGNVRTGMEDNIYLGKGELAQSNADLVAKTVRILRELSLEPATPDEARAMLGLKGRGRNVAVLRAVACRSTCMPIETTDVKRDVERQLSDLLSSGHRLAQVRGSEEHRRRRARPPPDSA